jgi:hypothetical protein
MIQHRNLALLRLAGSAERAELDALVGLERFIVHEFSPTELVIDPTQMKLLVERMEARGIRPMVRRWRPEDNAP